MRRPQYRPTERQRMTGPLIAAITRRNGAHRHPIWYVKVHGGRFQDNGLPDLCTVYRGWPIWFETKREPGEKGRPLQEWTMRELRKSGAIAMVPPTVAKAMAVYDRIDELEGD